MPTLQLFLFNNRVLLQIFSPPPFSGSSFVIVKDTLRYMLSQISEYKNINSGIQEVPEL
jgi:hypothetical protein